MELVEQLVRGVAEAAPRCPPWMALPTGGEPFGRLTYDEAFARSLGVEVLGRSTDELIQLADRELDAVPDSLDTSDRDGWLNLLLAERVEPTLGKDHPEFLYDFPSSQAALSRIRRGEVDVAERMELYIDGLEICNGYQELTDADELARRMGEQSQRRESAQRAGLPACAGVALGVDRLVMRTLGLERIEQVMAFPFRRA